MAALSTLIVRRSSLPTVALLLFLFTIYNLLFTFTILAGSGLVSQIGTVTFIQGASQFWVTSSRPIFSGITAANTSVSGTVGSQTVSASADASGNWSWTPTADLTGDNTVSITSGSQNVSFTLTIGALPENIASASGGTLAPAGNYLPTLLILGFGGILTVFGFWGLRRSFVKS